jgi:hypothetical protein
VPVWLVGTSAGSWSAARGAIGAGRDGIATGSIDGVVLTSTVTRIVPGSAFANALPDIERAYPDGVMSARSGAWRPWFPVDGDHQFQSMTTTCSGPWRPGQQDCGRAR